MNASSSAGIKITGLDIEQTRPSDRAAGLRHMHLRLTAEPPGEWQEMFLAERRIARHSMWRDAWIEGEYIVVDCVPEEIEKYHLNDLKQDVASTNQKYRDYLEKIERQNQQEGKAEQQEQERLKSIQDRLNFD